MAKNFLNFRNRMKVYEHLTEVIAQDNLRGRTVDELAADMTTELGFQINAKNITSICNEMDLQVFPKGGRRSVSDRNFRALESRVATLEAQLAVVHRFMNEQFQDVPAWKKLLAEDVIFIGDRKAG